LSLENLVSHPYFEGLESKARETPDAPFFAFHGGTEVGVLSYSDALGKIAAGSAYLRGQGVGEGDIVLIFAQAGPGLLLSFFGAQWHGAIPTLMPPPTVKQELGSWIASHTALIERIRPALVLAAPECLVQVQALAGARVVSIDEIEAAPSVACLAPLVASDDLDRIAFLQHSSGTTGLKKGVTVTYRQLLAQLDAYAESLGLNPRTANIVTWLPLYHDMGLIAATLLPFYFGLPVKIIETFAWLTNPASLMRLLSGTRDSYCWLPNFAFRHLARRSRLEPGEIDLSGVKAVINCSEPCKAPDMDAFAKRFAPDGLDPTTIQVCYAMAEYVFAVSQTRPGERVRTLDIDGEAFDDLHLARDPVGSARVKTVVSVGELIDGVELRIGNDLSDGQVGEIAVRGASMCSGYFRNEALTAIRFADGWYRTGDLGFQRDGQLYITGRGDDLIIVRGKNLYAHDLEEIMSATPGVKAGRSVAFGVEDASSGTQELILVAEIEDPALADEVTRDINGRISDVAGVAPAVIIPVRLNTLSKTTSGKMSRSENRRRFEQGALDAIGPAR
jgi:acyl-CoA synthetase (AMP-forming)/AMP-acid ligase II